MHRHASVLAYAYVTLEHKHIMTPACKRERGGGGRGEDQRLQLVIDYAARDFDKGLRGIERQVPLLRALKELTPPRGRQQQRVRHPSETETAIHGTLELAANHRTLDRRIQDRIRSHSLLN
jgi:hypothetical protein